MRETSYFIDHLNRRIHLKRYAGDRCGFLGAPIDKREFTNCDLYIENLIINNRYSRCKNCISYSVLATECDRGGGDEKS